MKTQRVIRTQASSNGGTLAHEQMSRRIFLQTVSNAGAVALARVTAGCSGLRGACPANPDAYTVERQIVSQGFDGKTCWVQARAGIIPPSTAVLTAQKLLLSGSDVFYAINSRRSVDGGVRWNGFSEQKTLGRLPMEEGRQSCPCDAWPTWHAASGKLLMTGHVAVYNRNNALDGSYTRQTFYSVYHTADDTWSAWRTLAHPEGGVMLDGGAGCTQRHDLPDGTILLPVYGRSSTGARNCYASVVLRCAFDGRELRVVEQGTPLTIDRPRGFCEPSVIGHKGEFFLTLRNDEKGFVSISKDGLHYSEPVPWCWDNGEEIGNYNTQQHWVSGGGGLFLVYTRRADNNGHVFRHRAPLFMARVAPQSLRLVRATERIIVPERASRLGNFGITRVSENESWVVVSEWMQSAKGVQACVDGGGDNRIWIARLNWATRKQRHA